MNGPEVVLILFLIRIVLPLTFLLWLGERVRRQEMKQFYGW